MGSEEGKLEKWVLPSLCLTYVVDPGKCLAWFRTGKSCCKHLHGTDSHITPHLTPRRQPSSCALQPLVLYCMEDDHYHLISQGARYSMWIKELFFEGQWCQWKSLGDLYDVERKVNAVQKRKSAFFHLHHLEQLGDLGMLQFARRPCTALTLSPASPTRWF